MAGRSSQVSVEVAAGPAVAPSKGRVAQAVLELAVTIGAAAPPAPPAVVIAIPQGGGGKFFLAKYNCYDCLLQLQQCIWDRVWCGGVKTCHPIMTREQKKRKQMPRFRRKL